MLHSLVLLLLPPAPAAVPQDPAPTVSAEALQTKVDEITPRVAKIRGWDFKKAVPAGVHTPEQFIDFAKEEFEAEYGMEKFRAMGQAYRLMGLIEPEIDDLYTTFLDLLKDQVGGYYDPKSAHFYMISTFNQGAMADVIMAHELCHALDDQYFGLEAMYEKAKGNSDREFAVRAVVEGSATSLMNLYTLDGMKNGYLDTAALMQEQMSMMDSEMAKLAEAPLYLVMTLSLPYLEGNKFLARTADVMASSMITPPEEDLKRAFREPPVSSEQVIHYEKYWDPEKRDDPTEVVMRDFSADLGAGWELADSDVLGELGAYFVVADDLPDLTEPTALFTSTWTNTASTGWDGDRYQYYRHEDGAGVLVWATVWDSEEDCKQFLDAVNDVTYNRNAFMVSAEGTGTKAVVWFANKEGRKHLDPLREAVRKNGGWQ